MSILQTIEKAIATAKVIAGGIETALQTATTVEGLIPIPGQGAAKMALVLAAVKAAYEPVYQAIEGFDVTKFLATITAIVGTFVSAANTAGIFTKKNA